MENFYTYKGYGIRYYQIGGNTVIEGMMGGDLIFEGKGMIDGNKLAREYIDFLDNEG